MKAPSRAVQERDKCDVNLKKRRKSFLSKKEEMSRLGEFSHLQLFWLLGASLKSAWFHLQMRCYDVD